MTTSESPPVQVLIVTTAHHPEDGRLVRHQRALRRAGVSVELVAIRSASRWRRFLTGPWSAYRTVHRVKPSCVILPDPELQLLLPPILRRKAGVISDVHEDYGAVADDRAWVRRGFRPALRAGVHLLGRVRQRWSDAVIIADPRLGDEQSILVTNRPNPLDLPRPTDGPPQPRLVYVGDIRQSRGSRAMLDLVAAIPGVTLDLIGPCQDGVQLQDEIERRQLELRVTWHGRLPYREAWQTATGALAGLSLLDDTPAFRQAIPTKLWEYWGVGLPVLASDLPGQSRLIEAADGGVTGNHARLRAALENWLRTPGEATRIGSQGHRYFATHDDGSEARLVATIRRITRSPI